MDPSLQNDIRGEMPFKNRYTFIETKVLFQMMYVVLSYRRVSRKLAEFYHKQQQILFEFYTQRKY